MSTKEQFAAAVWTPDRCRRSRIRDRSMNAFCSGCNASRDSAAPYLAIELRPGPASSSRPGTPARKFVRQVAGDGHLHHPVRPGHRGQAALLLLVAALWQGDAELLYPALKSPRVARLGRRSGDGPHRTTQCVPALFGWFCRTGWALAALALAPTTRWDVTGDAM